VKGIVFVGREGAERVKLLVPENDVVRLRLRLSGEVPGYGVSSQRAKREFGTLPLNLEYQTLICAWPHQIASLDSEGLHHQPNLVLLRHQRRPRPPPHHLHHHVPKTVSLGQGKEGKRRKREKEKEKEREKESLEKRKTKESAIQRRIGTLLY